MSEKNEELEAGDRVVINPNTRYAHEGTLMQIRDIPLPSGETIRSFEIFWGKGTESCTTFCHDPANVRRAPSRPPRQRTLDEIGEEFSRVFSPKH